MGRAAGLIPGAVIAIALSVALVGCGNGAEEASPEAAGPEAAGPGEETVTESPAVAAPILDGKFRVTDMVTKSQGIFRFGGVGTKTTRTYTFEPTCPTGDCPIILRQKTKSGFAVGEVAADGDLFVGTTTGPIHCYNNDTGEILRRGGYEGTFTHRIKPVATDESGDSVRITKFEGELTFSARAVKDPCNGSGRQVSSYVGTLLE